MPEGESKYDVFRYMTLQLKKIYAIYEKLCDFPVLLLLLLLQMYDTVFTAECKMQKTCRNMILTPDPTFHLVPPLYRDIWLRFDNKLHNSCYSY